MAPTQPFPGDSEMARRMREHGWSGTPLGPAEDWSLSLRSPLDICLVQEAEQASGVRPV